MSRASDLANVIASGSTDIVAEGTATTNLQQGLAKCWVNFSGQGTIAARDSNNLSSLTDDGTGLYDINFSNNMNNDDYAYSVNGGGGSTHALGNTVDDGLFTSFINVRFRRNDNNSSLDAQEAAVIINGDLA